MIRYTLACDKGHEFDGWFRDSAAYDRQAESGDLECPICSSHAVTKAIMAPAVARTDKPVANRQAFAKAEKMYQLLAQVRRYAEENCENVGDKFAEEARRIHYGDAPEREIVGEATLDDARELIEEGISVLPLPDLDTPQTN